MHFEFAGNDSPVRAFYNECVVQKHSPGSFFMCCGFSGGYFGIQDNDNENPGERRVLFSVWDQSDAENDAHATKADRVQTLYENAHVVVRRFGGEGTGAQCIDHSGANWVAGRKMRFCVMHRREEGETHACFGAWIWPEGDAGWTHLASFRVLRPRDDVFGGFYSFVEDFRRDGRSVFDERRASFGPAWCWSKKDGWVPASCVEFTASANDLKNDDIVEGGPVDAGAGEEPGTAYLSNGGATGRPGAGDEKLGVMIPRLEPGNEGPPAALPADPDAVFAEDCPVSPPKTALAQSNALGVWGVSARAFGVDFRLSF